MRQLLLLLAIVLLLFPITLRFRLQYDSQRLSLEIHLLFFCLFPYKKQFIYSFSSDHLSRLPALLPSTPKFSGNLHQGQVLLRYILPNIHIQKLNAELHLALADKYRLSLLYGLYWWLWGIFAPYCQNSYRLNFIPEYQNNSSYLLLDGIFSLTLGQIIFNTILLSGKKIYSSLQRRFKHGQPSY